MPNRTTKNPSRRIQVEQELAERLALQMVPAFGGEFPLASITRVELTRDLKDGVIWVTAAPAVDHAKLVAAIQSALPSWRQAVRRELSLRYFPNLVVRYDEGQADLLRIEALLENDANNTA